MKNEKNISVVNDFTGWTHAICKGCKTLFPIYDKYGKWNDLPPDNKVYCPDCQKKGLKVKQPKVVRLTPDKFLKVNKIKDKLIIKFFKKICRERGTYRRKYESILKEAMEIADLYREN